MTVTRAAAFPVQAASLREGALHDTAARQHAQRWRAHVSHGCSKAGCTVPPEAPGVLGGPWAALLGVYRRAAPGPSGIWHMFAASIAYGYRLNAWQTDWNKYFVRLPGCTRLDIDE